MVLSSVNYFDSRDHVTIPSSLHTLISRLAFPLLVFLSRTRSRRLGLIPIDDERVIMALKHAQGKLLDIGCGSNTLVHSYGNGIGVDVFPWKGVDILIQDAAKLPFPDQSFDTVSFLACLNHIPNRQQALCEAYRVLKPGGKIILTMITPQWGLFIHWLRFHHDPDHQQRHLKQNGEVSGLSDSDIRHLLKKSGFNHLKHQSFVYGLNHFYQADKT